MELQNESQLKFKCHPQNAGKSQPTKVKGNAFRQEIGSQGKLAECHSFWNRHSTRDGMRTSSTRDPSEILFEKPIHRPPVNQCFVKANPSSTSWAKHQARAHKMSTAHTQTTNSSVGQRGESPENG